MAGQSRQWDSVGRTLSPIVKINNNRSDDALLILNQSGKLYYYQMGTRRAVEIAHDEAVTSATFATSKKDYVFLSTSTDGYLRVWRMQDGRPQLITSRSAGDARLLYGSFAEGDDLMLTINDAGKAAFWTAQSSIPVKELAIPK